MPTSAEHDGDGWDVFLSHNSVDKPWVKELAARLESEPFDDSPSSRNIRVFLDIWDIPAGANIVTKLNEGMSKAKFLVIVMSPEFFKSNWTAVEWTHWVMGDPNNTQGRILPLLYRKVSLDKKEAISFPAPFRAQRFWDFSSKKAADSAYVELLSRIRGLATPRGQHYPPTPIRANPTVVRSERYRADDVNELLLSNLFPVTGYSPHLGMYPGHRIPNPLEIVEHHGDSSVEVLCQEILALTKLNWNSCSFASSEPITIQFARGIGRILTEVPEGAEIQSKYRFYM